MDSAPARFGRVRAGNIRRCPGDSSQEEDILAAAKVARHSLFQCKMSLREGACFQHKMSLKDKAC
jgi:hypothetical protein